MATTVHSRSTTRPRVSVADGPVMSSPTAVPPMMDMYSEMRNMLPPTQARQEFASWVESAEERFGHVPFCGARAQYILGADYVPVLTDGYSAMRWRGMGGETLLGLTSWATGWNVTTGLDATNGLFYTHVSAQGYSVDGQLARAKNAAEAMEQHRETVKVVMALATFHQFEASPAEDRQVMLAEPARV